MSITTHAEYTKATDRLPNNFTDIHFRFNGIGMDGRYAQGVFYWDAPGELAKMSYGQHNYPQIEWKEKETNVITDLLISQKNQKLLEKMMYDSHVTMIERKPSWGRQETTLSEIAVMDSFFNTVLPSLSSIEDLKLFQEHYNKVKPGL